MLHDVVLWKLTDVSEVLTASIIRVIFKSNVNMNISKAWENIKKEYQNFSQGVWPL
jgi:hypothetical protein